MADLPEGWEGYRRLVLGKLEDVDNKLDRIESKQASQTTDIAVLKTKMLFITGVSSIVVSGIVSAVIALMKG